MEIVKAIKDYMEDAGINYADAAKMIGWTKPNLWDKLNKRTELTFGSVVQIVCGLDADIKLTNMSGDADSALAELRFISRSLKANRISDMFNKIVKDSIDTTI